MMDLEIQKQRETPLLSRTRVSAMVTFEDETPSRAKLQQSIADKLKKNPKLVIIRHIYQRYGKKQAKVIAHVYDKEENIVQLEGKSLVEKHNKKEEPKKEEAPAPKAEEKPATEAKAEEPKAEEPKAEAKVEEPKAEEAKAEEPKAEEAKEEPAAEAKAEEAKKE